jgi:mono/diheme cytochrome c family protein
VNAPLARSDRLEVPVPHDFRSRARDVRRVRRPTAAALARPVTIAAIALAAAATARAAPALVERGEYLARAGDCVSCHTAKGGAPFAGGARIDTPFGYMLAPNITPEPETGIGRWSQDDFDRALRRGVNRRGQDMYPTMPYDFYTRVTREDSDAIYAYLRTVKPVRNAVDVNHLRFPFDVRWSMAVWRELYFKPGAYRPDPAKPAAWNRGAYLVEGLGHCGDCHSPRNLLGGIEKRSDFAGAAVDGWFALDLTSDIVTGLGTWTVADIATYLETGAYEGRTTTLGPMAEVIRNSLSHLTEADRTAMAEYLKSIPPDSRLRTGLRPVDPDHRASATLYLDHCAGCHQARGRGVPGVFPPLAGNGVVLAAEPTDIIDVVLKGLPARGGYVPMPSFAPQLSDGDIADIANYVRTSWGNAAAANATAAMVAKRRAAAK